MRALVLREFGAMEVQERPEPVPASGEVLVRIVATGICGSDIHGFTGANGRRRPGQVMGHETVGRIAAGERTGEVVTINPLFSCRACEICRSGRRMACPRKKILGVAPDLVAAFAEYVAVPAENTVALPDRMPVDHGALIEPLAVALHAVRRGGCGPGDAVLVLGGGPIGQSAVLAAVRAGARAVAVSEPDPARRHLCERLGATALDPAGGGLPARVASALGGPASLAVDAVGASATLADALSSTEEGGRVVLVGMQAPEVSVPAFAVSTAERSLIGSFAYTDADFAETAAFVGEGGADFAALISETVGMADAPEVFSALGSGRVPPGKILVRCGEEPD